MLFEKLSDIVREMKVESISDLRKFILSSDEKLEITGLRESIVTLKSEVKAKEEQLLRQKAKLQELNSKTKIETEEKTILQLETELASVDVDEAKLNEHIGSIRQKLRANEQTILKKKSINSELKQVKQSSRKYILLAEMIGDKEGKRWATYAQNLSFMQLISRANARLESLTDRYVLYFNPEEENLIVIDKYAGDSMRAIETLSGGETFILSLALALSLSDFASNSIAIHSLFIDEGFSTLDNETLDIVMTTLEKLQDQSGKTIGIISHLESLKERINTQIKVRKASDGFSTLEIV